MDLWIWKGGGGTPGINGIWAATQAQLGLVGLGDARGWTQQYNLPCGCCTLYCRYGEAMYCLDRALALHSEHVRAHYSRGQVKGRAGCVGDEEVHLGWDPALGACPCALLERAGEREGGVCVCGGAMCVGGRGWHCLTVMGECWQFWATSAGCAKELYGEGGAHVGFTACRATH